MERHARHSRGFTLVEMLVVIAIIGVLIGVAIPAFGDQTDRTKFTVDVTNVRTGYSQALVIVYAKSGQEYDQITANGGIYLLADGSLGPSKTSSGAEADLYHVSVGDYRNKLDCTANIGGHDVDFSHWGSTVTYQWYPDTNQLRINDNYLQF